MGKRCVYDRTVLLGIGPQPRSQAAHESGTAPDGGVLKTRV
jgi:hypothetical protein